MLSHNRANRPKSNMTLFRRVCQVAAPGANLMPTIALLLIQWRKSGWNSGGRRVLLEGLVGARR